MKLHFPGALAIVLGPCGGVLPDRTWGEVSKTTRGLDHEKSPMYDPLYSVDPWVAIMANGPSV